MAITVYFLVASKLEQIHPRAGFLLFGAKGKPKYDVDGDLFESNMIAAQDHQTEKDPAVPFG